MSEPKPTSAFEALAKRFGTVGATWHDAYCEWHVVVDGGRRLYDDCAFKAWGETLDEAVAAVLRKVDEHNAKAAK